MSKKLHVVGGSTPPLTTEPPRQLGMHGQALWRSITDAYDISDAGGVEMLAQACAALDRAESCAVAINNDGEVLRKAGVVKAHPLLRDELSNRGFVVKTLRVLGLDVEAVRPGRGRPPGPGFA